MGMGIDEPWQDNAPREIEPFRPTRSSRAFDPPPRSNRDNPIFMDQESAVSNNSQLGERPTAPRNTAPKGQELRASGDQPVRHGKRLDSSVYWKKNYHGA